MAINQEKTKMTQRLLTADELGICRSFYAIVGHMRFLGDTYHLNMLLPQVADAIEHATTDGKPLRTERVPTAADIGKRVKVRRSMSEHWTDGCDLVGFEKSGRFVVQSSVTDSITAWQFCIIDEEAAQ
jgi:hypothetical protein